MAATTEMSEEAKILRRMSVEKIEDLYRRGHLFAEDRNYMLREKARYSLEDLISEKGTSVAMMQRVWDNAKEGWDKVIEVATRDTEGETSKSGLYQSFHAMLGILQVIGSVSEGIGEVAGMNAEKMALANGAPPGLARFFNTLTWLGVQVVPVGAAAKAATKVGEKVLPKISAGLAKEAASAKLSKEAMQELHALKAFADGLAEDGVKDAGKLVKRAAKEGKSEAADALDDSKVIEEITEATKPLTSGVTERTFFLDDVKQFAGEVDEKQARAALPALMKKFGISWNDLKSIKPLGGKSLTAEQFYGYLKALEGRGVEMAKLAKEAVSEGSTPGQQAAFMRYATELFTGATDKATVTREFQNLLMHWDPANVAKGDLAAAMKTFAEDMAALPTRLVQRNMFNNQQGFLNLGSHWGQAAREMYANLLLPLSWPAATIGNMYGTGTKIAERFVGGDVRGALHIVQGMTMATGDAMQAGWMAYATSGARNAIPGRFGRIVNFQRDTLIAVDSISKTLIGRGLLYADAIAQAERLGVRNVGGFVRSFMANPPAGFWSRAYEASQKATYSNDLGWLGSTLTQLLQGGPGTLYFTFIKSPINLAKFAWNRTPGLQLISRELYRDIAAGGQRANDAMGRLTIASMQGLLWYEMAKQGLITGSGPADPSLQKAWRLTHEPFSIKTPKGWVPFSRMEPATQTLGFVADIVQVMDQLDDVTFQQASMAVTFALVKNFANATAWRSASEIIDMINGVARGEKITARDVRNVAAPALAATTLGPVVSRTARIIDPVQRDMRTLADAWKARVPGYSKEVPPMRDGLGDPIFPPETIGTPWFGYFTPAAPRMRVHDDDPIKAEAARLKVRLPVFGDALGAGELPDDMDITQAQPGDPVPVKLSPQQRDRWIQIWRNIVHGSGTDENPGIKELMDSEDYKEAPVALKREMFGTFLSVAKQQASSALLMEDTELGKQVIQGAAANEFPKLTEQQQQEAAQQTSEAVQLFQDVAPEQYENLLRWGIVEPDKEYKAPAAVIMGVEVGGQMYKPYQLDPKTGVPMGASQ